MFTNKSGYMLLVGLFLLQNVLICKIVDSPVATLSPAERAWLIDQENQARSLFINEIDSAAKPEIPAYNAAFLSYRAGDFKETDKYLEIALTSNPKYGPALMLKGLTEYDRHNLKNCYENLKKAIRYHDYPELPNYHLGRILADRKKYREAIEYFENAISDNKLYTFSYSALGEMYIHLHKIEDALRILKKGFENSHDAQIIFLLARAHALAGNEAEAIKFYGLFSYLYPQHPQFPAARAFLQKYDARDYWTNGLKPLPDRQKSAIFYPVGEDILYSVYWGPIRVGELNTIILDTLTFQGQKAFKVRFSLDSNPALEFIASLHSDYITIIDRYTKQTIRHFLHQREMDLVADKVYDYDRINGLFHCRTIREDGHIDYLQKYLPTNCIDGTSILFYARQVVADSQNEIVLTTIDEDFVLTDIIVDGTKEAISVRKEEQIAENIHGELHYNGIVGFTGKFQGWFQENEIRVPLGADFEIWIGRIKVSVATAEEQILKKYNR